MDMAAGAMAEANSLKIHIMSAHNRKICPLFWKGWGVICSANFLSWLVYFCSNQHDFPG